MVHSGREVEMKDEPCSIGICIPGYRFILSSGRICIL